MLFCLVCSPFYSVAHENSSVCNSPGVLASLSLHLLCMLLLSSPTICHFLIHDISVCLPALELSSLPLRLLSCYFCISVFMRCPPSARLYKPHGGGKNTRTHWSCFLKIGRVLHHTLFILQIFFTHYSQTFSSCISLSWASFSHTRI